MNKITEIDVRGKHAHYVLKDTAGNLTGKDLMKIIEIAEKVRASVHVSHGTHQIFIGVPTIFRATMDRTMKNIGFRYAKKSERLLENGSFLLEKKHYAVATLKPSGFF